MSIAALCPASLSSVASAAADVVVVVVVAAAVVCPPLPARQVTPVRALLAGGSQTAEARLPYLKNIHDQCDQNAQIFADCIKISWTNRELIICLQKCPESKHG